MRVAIIGGGAVGLFCAWRLAERGAAVTLVEPRSLLPADPSAASWAAAGMLGAVSEALSEPDAPARVRIGLSAIEAWRRAATALAPARTLFDVGSIILADSLERLAAIEALHALAQAHGAETALLPRAELRARGLAAGPQTTAGLLAPFEALVDIPGALAALTMKLADVGVAVREGRGADVETAGGFPTLVLEGGARLNVDAVLACPGVGPHGRLAEAIPALARLTPAKGQMALISATVPFVVRAQGVYLAPRPEGLVLGSTMERGRDDRTVDPAAIAALRDAASRAAPTLADAPLIKAWAGVRPMSPDGWPIVGSSGPPGCFAAAGHSRNGWLLAPLTAEIIADMIFKGADAPPEFDPRRFAASTKD